MKAMENVSAWQTNTGSNKLKFLDPRPFKGNRDAKELENFIFDLEQYFKATPACTDDIKVTVASMYLDEAKLWWRTNVQDIENGLCTIDSWEDLKRELRDQFLPENVDHLAMEKLIALKQTGSIRDYVRQFLTPPRYHGHIREGQGVFLYKWVTTVGQNKSTREKGPRPSYRNCQH